MKKIVILIIVISIITIISTTSILLLSRPDKNAERINSTLYQRFQDSTYSFTGKSNSFEFKIGRAYLTDNENRIYLDDFRQTKEIDGIESLYLHIYFNDELSGTYLNTDKLNNLNNTFDSLSFYEGKICPNNNGECEYSPFENATKDNFKDGIKVIIEYCLENKTCKEEPFKLSYE